MPLNHQTSEQNSVADLLRETGMTEKGEKIGGFHFDHQRLSGNQNLGGKDDIKASLEQKNKFGIFDPI